MKSWSHWPPLTSDNRNQKPIVRKSPSGWWFQTFFIFHHIWDNPSDWLSYVSRWLKPPTSHSFIRSFIHSFIELHCSCAKKHVFGESRSSPSWCWRWCWPFLPMDLFTISWIHWDFMFANKQRNEGNYTYIYIHRYIILYIIYIFHTWSWHEYLYFSGTQDCAPPCQDCAGLGVLVHAVANQQHVLTEKCLGDETWHHHW
jgi:hypothetical protein